MEAKADIGAKKKRRRIITAVAAGSVLLIWLLYLFLTSSFFLRTALLPVLSHKLGAKVHAQEVHFSPLSGSLRVKYLTIGDNGSQMLQCQHLYLSCSLLALPGKVNINDLYISGVKISLKQDAAGKWNPPLLNQLIKNSEKTNRDSETDNSNFELPQKIVLPFQLKVKKVNITDVAFHIESAVAGNPFKVDISDIKLSLKNLIPSCNTNLEINAKFKLKHRQAIINDGRLNFNLQADLNASLMPDKLILSQSAKVVDGKLNNIDISGNKLAIASNLSFDGNKFEIGNMDIDYHNAKNILSSINLTASGALSPLAVKFKLHAPLIPETILDLIENFTGFTGLGYAEVSLFTEMAYQHRILTTKSDIHVRHHIAGQDKSLLPEIYLDLEENINIDFKQKNLDVKQLKINMRGKNSGNLTVSLSEPFAWNWTSATSSDSVHPEIFVRADNIHPSIINPLTATKGIVLGSNGSISGIMSTSFDRRQHCIKLVSKFAGSNLDMSVPGYQVSAVSFVLKLTASTMDMKNISFSPTILVQHRGKTVGQVDILGAMDLPSKLLTFKVNVSQANQATLYVLPEEVRNLKVMQELMTRLSPFEMKVETNGNLDLKKQNLNVARANVEVDRRKQGNLKVSFLSPWPLDLSAQGDDILPKPMNTNVIFTNMDAEFVNMFLPDSQKINSGRVYARLKTRLDIMKEKLDTSGPIKLVSGGMRTGSLEFKNLAIASNVNVAMDQWTTLNIKNFDASIYNGRTLAAKLRNKSDFDFNADNMRITTQITELTQEAVKVLQSDFPVNFKLCGNTVFSMQNGYKRPLIQAELTADNITSNNIHTPLAADFRVDIFPKNNTLVINKLEGFVKRKRKRLTNFNIDGIIATPLHSGKTKLRLASNKLDLKLLEDILGGNQPLEPQKVPSSPDNSTIQPEPDPIKLNADAELDLDLKNITYGSNITASCSKSILRIKNDQVIVNPLNIKLNDNAIVLRGMIDLGKAGGYPYAVTGTANQVYLGPILHTFSDNKNRTVSGEVSNFIIKLTGKGFTRKNIDSNLNGEVKFNVKDLSIPDSLKSIRTIRIVLLPVESFAQIINYLPKLGTASFSKSLNAARNVYNDVDNLHLKEGEVDLQINSGIVNIDKFHFTGDFIQKMDFSGYVPIDPNAPMKLVSNLDVYYLAVPLDINGTFNSPSPNIRKMVTYFLPQNIYNIMKSAPVRGIIKGSVKETENILKRTGKIITDSIFGPTPKKQDDSKQKENSDRIEQLFNQ